MPRLANTDYASLLRLRPWLQGTRIGPWTSAISRPTTKSNLQGSKILAITNQERVGKALELLKDGLGPFVDREVQDKIKADGVHMDTIRRFVDDPHLTDKPIDQWDVAALLKLMWETWNDVFRNVLGQAERSLVSEIRGHRNKWAHQNSFSSDDADRTLDSIARLLTAVSASQADEVNRMKMELRRLVFEEQARSERRPARAPLSKAKPPAA